MRVLFFGNNWVGWQVMRWLKDQGEEIVGLVLHPPSQRSYGPEIIRQAKVDPSRIYDGSLLHERETVRAIREMRPEIGISVLFDYILKPDLLRLFPRGVINLHPAYLPYNRGQYPNVWSIVEETPAGVTLHYINEGIDTGDIIDQQTVPVEFTDTGETLYRKLEKAAVDLFTRSWPRIRSGKIRSTPQNGGGTCHKRQDVEKIDEIHLDRSYKARDLIDLLRARTFPPFKGAYCIVNGRRVYLRLQLVSEEDLKP